MNGRCRHDPPRLGALRKAASLAVAAAVLCGSTLAGAPARAAISTNPSPAPIATPQPCPAAIVPAPVSAATPSPLPSPGALHPGDKITVTVLFHPELTGDVVVTPDFTIVVPQAGGVDVRGKSFSDVASAIASRLTMVISPAVDVKLVSQSNTAFLAGSATGTVALKPGDRLATALTDAKIAPTGDLTRVGIMRNGVVSAPYDVRALRAAKDPGPLLVSGDVINVPSKAVVVAVSGAVKAPGTAYLDAGEPLSDALVQVPVSDDADTGYVQLTRDGVTCYTGLGRPVLAAGGQSGDELVIGRPAHVTVGGSVAKAGTVTLKGDRSLVNAVALAGGPTKEGNLHDILVMRAGSTDKGTSYDVTLLSQGQPAANPDLADGDSVYVTQAKTRIDPRAIFLAILAAAKKYAKLAL